jgi:hypothetical protein
MNQTIRILVHLTPAEAAALQHAIDLYFQGRINSPSADLIEQMHSKLSTALAAAGHCCDDPDDDPAP